MPQSSFLLARKSDKERVLAVSFLIDKKSTSFFFLGKYWLDPNGGCTEDAFQAECRFSEGGQTCLHPSKQHVRRTVWYRRQSCKVIYL